MFVFTLQPLILENVIIGIQLRIDNAKRLVQNS